jgi:hypothetical protein
MTYSDEDRGRNMRSGAEDRARGDMEHMFLD